MRFSIHLVVVAVVVSLTGCSISSKDEDMIAPTDSGQVESAIYNVRVTDGVEYGRGSIESGDMPLLLDLYEPIGDDSLQRPGLLIIHGGGFVRGSRKMEQLAMFAREFASRGYLVASMDYRLSGDDPELKSVSQKLLSANQAQMSEAMREAYRNAGLNHKAPWAAFEDAIVALQWLRATAALNVDPSRIAVLGSSAGAFTALNLGYRLNDVAPEIAPPAAVTSIWGQLEHNDTNVLESGEPPLLLIHGTADKIVNFNSSLALYLGAQSANIPVEFVPLEGHGHSLNRDANDFFKLRVNSGVTVFDKILTFTNAALLAPNDMARVSCDAVGDACPKIDTSEKNHE